MQSGYLRQHRGVVLAVVATLLALFAVSVTLTYVGGGGGIVNVF